MVNENNTPLRWNIITNALASMTNLGLSFVLVPVVIFQIGLFEFGVWEIVLSFSAVLLVFQFPLYQMLVWDLANSYGSGNLRQYDSKLRLSIVAWISFCTVLCGAVFSSGEFILKLLNITSEPATTNYFGFFVASIFWFSLDGVNRCLAAGLTACQRIGIASMIRVFAHILNIIIVIVLAYLKVGIMSLPIGMAAEVILVAIALSLYLHWHLKLPYLSGWKVSIVSIRKLLNKTHWYYFNNMLMVSLAGLIRESGDRMVIAAIAVPEMVAFYGIAARLASPVLLVCSYFFGPVTAAAGMMLGSGQANNIRNLYRLTLTRVTAITVILGGGLVLIHPWLFKLWLGFSRFEINIMFLWLISGYAAAAILTSPGTSIGRGVGWTDLEKKYEGIGVLINVTGKVLLIPFFGIFGSVAASSLSYAVSSIFYFIWVQKRIKTLSH